MRCIKRIGNSTILQTLMAISAGVCWGISTFLSNYLFAYTKMEPTWFVCVKMIISGSAIVTYVFLRRQQEILAVLKNRMDMFRCVINGGCFVLLFQICCYKTVQIANAATATVLQYISTVIVMLFCCIRAKRIPTKKEGVAILLAFLGIFLLSTHGVIGNLVISKEALFYGIGSAIFMAAYTIFPSKIYEKYSVVSITGISLLIGGLLSSFFVKPLSKIPDLKLIEWGILLMAISIGSILGYLCYAKACSQMDKAKVCLFSSSEIPTAIICSALFQLVTIDVMDCIGTIMIFGSVVMDQHKGLSH